MTEGESEEPADEAWLERSPEEIEERQRRHHERREAHRRKVRRQRRRKRIAIAAGVTLATLLVLGVTWFWWTFGGLERMPESVGQAGASTPGTNILLVGSDPAVSPSSNGHHTWRDDLDHSQLVMLLHMTESGQALYVISIPSDGIVDIPGVGPGKLSDAATSGGPRLVARTVEELTGVRLDRFAVLDLNAFREITDVLDGVVVDVPRAVCDLPAGPRRFDGQAALDYLTLQPCMPRKDLDRVERQQSLVRGLIRGALDGGAITHPFALNRMLRATSTHLAVEHGFSYPAMFRLLWSMRHVRTGNTTFLTVPVAAKPLATQDGTDYVVLDEARDQELWQALRDDRLVEYLALGGGAELLPGQQP